MATQRAAELQAKINDEKARLKDYQAELKALKGTSGRSTKPKPRETADDTVIISASSCGRVKSVPRPTALNGIVHTLLVSTLI